ncbi:MAG: HAD-IB family hydrolase [Spirochaetales bacterium]|uniref:phosphoserine phosphatase n=1 Tax=Candidatus Thalassospirochaeta sargassi TaxID=3119039 RepID=A0AAJ1ICZ6_9SPIO|nr:HAD-IB family hydrolase [Spirochaetales bacterium]
MKQNNTAAFFDIDGTLYRDSLMIEHFKKLLKYDILDEALWHINVKHTYENWKKRRGNYDDYLLELAKIYTKALAGLEKTKMDFVTDQVIKLKGDKVYMYTRDKIEQHKQNGHLVFFVSGSPDYLVSRMAELYGITDSIGTKYHLDENGRYTGEVSAMWDSESKKQAIRCLCGEYGIDLNRSYSYGDTNGDISMFRMTGNAVAINPTRELIYQLKNDPELSTKVKIRVERKDVVYKLDSAVEISYPEI